MIKNEQEYKITKLVLKSLLEYIVDSETRMKSLRMAPMQISLAIDPLRAYAASLQEDISEYEKNRA